MQVQILNPEVLETLYKNHGEFARICYDTPEEYAEKVGKACVQNGHMSGSRCEYIKFRFIDIDRGTAEQCMRHEIGVRVPYEESDNYSFSDYAEQVIDVDPISKVQNCASFRYIDKSGFTYTIPKEIEKYPYACKQYKNLMDIIEENRKAFKEFLVANDVDEKRANECANFVLPRCTNSSLTMGFTPEALINFMHKRLCARAQPEIHAVAVAMKKEVEKYNERFAKELVPHCQHLLWCPEGRMSCGAVPTKKKLQEMIEGNKEK